ncbi:MAG: gliding motility-associated C-terminal domain-containing protein [Spirochaetes bacterium]|nr:gliding motility-associated C-terminal domain-containing protein [Spirochaetota bacterium]
MKPLQRIAVLLSILVLSVSLASAYDPPAGADGIPFLVSPGISGGSMSVASTQGASSDALNPASSAGLQRVTLDAGYAALVGLGAESGWGSLINLGLAIPQPYGVWSVGMNFTHVPATLSSMPLGTLFTLRGGISKDLYPDLYVGTGLDVTLGSNGGTDWGLGLDLGFVHFLGRFSFLQNVRWGGALRNLGKSFQPPAGVNGFAGTTASSYDSPFTPAFGIAADLLNHQTSGIRIGSSMDLYFPSFQNVVFNVGLEFAFREMIFVRSSWDINLRESMAQTGRSLLPSFGIAATIPITRTSDDSFISQRGWDRSDIQPQLSARPLYNDVWAFGLGASLPLGVVDKNAPEISLVYPESEWELYYMSPNNDGIKDELVLPLTITDQRYVQSFKLTIYDEAGNPVRSLANKESRPETTSFAGIWDRLKYVKKGVDVPVELIWNGLTDEGSLVPDGTYSFSVEAVDDNGNIGLSETYKLVVDNTPPELAVVKPEGANALVFSPDGDGNKDTLSIVQSGSSEDRWLAEFLDVAGIAVFTYTYTDSAPVDLTWKGTGQDETIVADGVYSYIISATDRAGNSSSATLDNILINTQQPPVSISIDQAAFSPNSDGVKDELAITASVPVRTGISAWTLSVLDERNVVRWSTSGSDGQSLPARTLFQGKGSDGAILPEAAYRAKIAIRYVNGHSPESLSAPFIIDVTPPTATARLDRIAFNPLADTNAVLTITQSGSSEERWLGEIVARESGTSVRSWSFTGQPDAKVVWDGADEAGRVVADASYFWRLSANDRAGNSFSTDSALVRIDTGNKAVRLAVDMRAFSPNSDGTKDVMNFLPEAASTATVVSWSLSILNEGKESIRRFTGNNAPPASVRWDGKNQTGTVAANGVYSGQLEVRYDTGETEQANSFELTLDTVAPSLELSSEYLLFSPNGSGRKDTLTIRQSAVPGDNWDAEIKNAAGESVRVYNWRNQVDALTWDGTDANGNRLPDGVYTYTIRAEDAAGNVFSTGLSGITVDARIPQLFVTMAAPGFSPTGNGRFDTISIGVLATIKDGMESWRMVVLDERGITRKTWQGNAATRMPEEFIWDGKADDGSVTQGSYTTKLSVDYVKGDRVEAVSTAFLLDSGGPRAVIAIGPEYFSPDNDGIDDELRVSLSVSDISPIESWTFEIIEVAVQEGSAARRERSFFTWSGRGMPAERLVWDGRSQRGELVEAATDYPYRFTIEDAYGNKTVREGLVKVDVLVIRDGDRLKIKVPSIVFRSNAADFNNLPADVLATNDNVLRRIAQILNRFRDYNIRIEGHANSLAKIQGLNAAAIEREESVELLPLSENRAKLVMEKLISFGVDKARLTVRGLGSSEPVVPFSDAENRWKNRRVEFILLK